MSLVEVCRHCNELTTKFLALSAETFMGNASLLSSTQQKLLQSISVLSTLLQHSKLDEISLSFNGGKDCLVLLVIYLSTLYEHFTPLELSQFNKINCILINYETQFPELVDFIADCTTVYQLDLVQYNNISLKEGFEKYLREYPQFKSVIIGQRRSDPYSQHLQPIQDTDNHWPHFQRVHPVLDWHYDEIWLFLRELDIDYCILYDMGYTSIGGVGSTVPNPHLRQADGSYRPAFQLTGPNCDEIERDGRFKHP
jgi:3'-phosphoadenosine 5'-phosphosulfate sulfotransferase (PAPS reductase)/FAD synthetase